MYSLKPLAARLNRKLRPFEIDNVAAETIEIHRPTLSNRPKAIYIDGELERIESSYLSLDHEIARVQGGERQEGATVGYAIDDAVISRGVIYKGNRGFFLRGDAPKIFDYQDTAKECESVLTTNISCEKFFGDWLIQSLCLRILAEEWQLPAVEFSRAPYLHQPDYEKLTNLPAKLIQSARIDRLWIIDDRGMNESRQARIIELGKRVRALVRLEKPKVKVLLLRGILGKGRYIINDTEVVLLAERRGFLVLNPEFSSVSEIINNVCNASFVLTVEGSVQMHALLAMPSNSCLIIIQPSKRFTAPGKDIADILGIKYAFLVAESKEDGIFVNLKRLDQLLELSGA